MRVGIDGFCYHRYFGQAYPGIETIPASPMTAVDFVDKAAALGADGLAIESFMLPSDPYAAAEMADEVGTRAEEAGLHLMWAWGHPNGLGSGFSPEAMADLRMHADLAAAQGVSVMRICAGGRATRPPEWAEHRQALLPLLAEATEYAGTNGLVMAVENHADLYADELVDLIETIDSSALGVCLDTANNLRMLEDVDRAIELLAPYAKAVHLKDVQAQGGDPRTFTFWPSVPIGSGLIDIPKTLKVLHDNRFDGLLAIEIDYLHPKFGLDEDGVLRDSIAYTRDVIAAL